MQELSGNVAVVTGAASGMGRAFAQRFAEEGMKVVLADIEAPALDAAVREMRQAEHDVIAIRTDVTKLADVQALARQALDAFGKVHVVCNNAGVEGYLEGPIWEATDRDWAWTFGVNFWGVVHGVRTFLPILLEQGEEAHVVNTCSATSIVMPGNMYGISKHAVLALSEVVCGQLRQRDAKVGITALCPGIIRTRLFEGWRNRPVELRNEDEPEGTKAGRELRRTMHERLNTTGMEPSTVAGLLIEAIRNNVFYLVTDHDWDERIKARADAIMNRTNPG
jgi:NAD(P)-dependent dehydrogenase (short-subunit alcohol dehydrogenase family)